MDDIEKSKTNFVQLFRTKTFRDNGFEIEEAVDGPELYFPINSNELEAFDDADKRFILDTAERCREYTSGLIIKDLFGKDHSKRRKWRQEMYDQYGMDFWEFYDKNKLRSGIIIGPTHHLYALADMIKSWGIDTKWAKRIRGLVQQLPHEQLERYKELDDTEKLAAVRQIDRVCRSFLRLVTGIDVLN